MPGGSYVVARQLLEYRRWLVAMVSVGGCFSIPGGYFGVSR